MREQQHFTGSEDIARRAGVEGVRYRTANGLYVLNESDLRMIRMEPQEFITGLDVTPISAVDAAKLIAAAGTTLGMQVTTDEQPSELVEQEGGTNE